MPATSCVRQRVCRPTWPTSPLLSRCGPCRCTMTSDSRVMTWCTDWPKQRKSYCTCTWRPRAAVGTYPSWRHHRLARRAILFPMVSSRSCEEAESGSATQSFLTVAIVLAVHCGLLAGQYFLGRPTPVHRSLQSRYSVGAFTVARHRQDGVWRPWASPAHCTSPQVRHQHPAKAVLRPKLRCCISA